MQARNQGVPASLHQRWTILNNSAVDISDESAIDAFRRGMKRIEFKDQLGQMKVRTLAWLLEQANSWADGEDSVRNETKIHIAPSEDDYDYHTGDKGLNIR